VHLGIAYDVAEGSFPFHHTKTIFYFLDAKNKFFCEATTKLKFYIAIKTFFKNTRPP
jgi:hypothetical protein